VNPPVRSAVVARRARARRAARRRLCCLRSSCRRRRLAARRRGSPVAPPSWRCGPPGSAPRRDCACSSTSAVRPRTWSRRTLSKNAALPSGSSTLHSRIATACPRLRRWESSHGRAVRGRVTSFLAVPAVNAARCAHMQAACAVLIAVIPTCLHGTPAAQTNTVMCWHNLEYVQPRLQRSEKVCDQGVS